MRVHQSPRRLAPATLLAMVMITPGCGLDDFDDPDDDGHTIVTLANDLSPGNSLAAVGDTLLLAYIDDYELRVARSVDRGASWHIDAAQALATAEGPTTMVVDDDTIYLLFTGDYADRNLYLVRSDDAGVSWSVPTRAADVLYMGSVVLDDGTLHAAYARDASDGDALTYARSTDGGANWSVVPVATGLALSGIDAHIGRAGSYLTIFHRGESGAGNQLARSADDGASWTNESVFPASTIVRTLSWGGELFVAHYDADGDLGLLHTTDSQSWDESAVATADIAYTGPTLLAAENDSILVAYQAAAAGATIQLARSDDRAATFASPALAYSSVRVGLALDQAAMVIDNDEVFIAFTLNRRLKLTVSRDGGATWAAR